MNKVLNKEKTVKAILDKCNRSIGMSINIEKFNEEIQQPNAEEFILDACTLCEVEPVYDKI